MCKSIAAFIFLLIASFSSFSSIFSFIPKFVSDHFNSIMLLRSQLNALRRQIRDHESLYFYSRIVKSTLDHYSSFSGMGSGYGAKLALLEKQYQKKLGYLSNAVLKHGISESLVKQADIMKGIVGSALSSDQMVQTRTSQYISNLNQLMSQSDQSPNIKSSVDLNTSMLGQLSLISMDQMALSNQLIKVNASSQHERALSVQQLAKFNTLMGRK